MPIFPSEPFGLYLILTAPRAGYRACAEAAVAEGVRFLQLRMKNAPPEAVLSEGREIRAITRGTATQLIINDDVTLAAELDADGVHLGQEDMPLDEARRTWGRTDRMYGLSTHSLAQVAAAERIQPDYIGIGPVFPTPAKGGGDAVIGLDGMAAMLRVAPCPAVVIGGINADNLSEVRMRGAANYAVIRAVCEAADPRSAIRRLREIERQYPVRAVPVSAATGREPETRTGARGSRSRLAGPAGGAG